MPTQMSGRSRGFWPLERKSLFMQSRKYPKELVELGVRLAIESGRPIAHAAAELDRGAKRRGKPWRTTTQDPAAGRRPDLVSRDFTAAAPDCLWAGDLTYLRCWEGWLFFSFVVDVFSRRIVGWQLASHMRTDLVLDALRIALGDPAARR